VRNQILARVHENFFLVNSTYVIVWILICADPLLIKR
jgi:hypothetical protein